MMRLVSRYRWPVGLLLAVATYVNSYIGLSVGGAYRPSFADMRWVRRGQMCAMIVVPDIWQPRFVRCADGPPSDPRRNPGNWLGFLYAPLVALDQAVWHPMRVPSSGMVVCD